MPFSGWRIAPKRGALSSGGSVRSDQLKSDFSRNPTIKTTLTVLWHERFSINHFGGGHGIQARLERLHDHANVRPLS